MKKGVTIAILVLVFFVIYFLQANFFSWFTIANVKPNLFVVYILFIGLFAGKKIAPVLGLILGICLDLLIGRTIGITGIMLMIIGIIGEYLDKNFSKESRLTIMLMVMGSTAIFEIGLYFFNVFRLDMNLEIFSFAKILLIEVIYNTILVVIIYPLMQKTGYGLEHMFKVKNILTRYF